MKTLDLQKIRTIVRRIIHEEVERDGLRVRKIFLFGSRVHGNADEKSDWDFYILVTPTVSARKRWDIADRICERLAEVGIWADVFVQNEAIMFERQNDPGYLTYYVLREGVEL